MAKIIGPPPITNLDGIINLLTDPDKYVQYLKDLKALHEAITASLALVNTVEKADQYLAEATATVTRAQEAERRAKELHQEILADIAKKQAEQEHASHAKDRIHLERDMKIAAREQEMEHTQRALTAQQDALTKQAQDLAAREQRLLQKHQDLTAKEEKLTKAGAALAALGV